jgi:tripartite-type tricarboxylate transporter receptor subunit TctC
MDLAKTEEGRKLLELFSGPSLVGRSVMAPPGLPAERVAELRAAFMRAIGDADFKADADRMRLDLDPLPGEKLQAMLTDMRYPPELLEKAREIANKAGQ